VNLSASQVATFSQLLGNISQEYTNSWKPLFDQLILKNNDTLFHSWVQAVGIGINPLPQANLGFATSIEATFSAQVVSQPGQSISLYCNTNDSFSKVLRTLGLQLSAYFDVNYLYFGRASLNYLLSAVNPFLARLANASGSIGNELKRDLPGKVLRTIAVSVLDESVVRLDVSEVSGFQFTQYSRYFVSGSPSSVVFSVSTSTNTTSTGQGALSGSGAPSSLTDTWGSIATLGLASAFITASALLGRRRGW